MSTPHHTRRSGLGRPVAEIVGGPEPAASRRAPGGLLRGPAVVPMDVVPFPMLIADAAGRALAVNQRWAEVSGLGRDASLDYGWLAVLRAEDRLALRSQVERVAAGDPDLRAEYTWLPAGGPAATWWLASHHRAGERLVGIAVVSIGPAAGGRSGATSPASAVSGASTVSGAGALSLAGAGDPVREQLAALLLSLRELLDTLDRLVERVAPAEMLAV